MGRTKVAHTHTHTLSFPTRLSLAGSKSSTRQGKTRCRQRQHHRVNSQVITPRQEAMLWLCQHHASRTQHHGHVTSSAADKTGMSGLPTLVRLLQQAVLGPGHLLVQQAQVAVLVGQPLPQLVPPQLLPLVAAAAHPEAASPRFLLTAICQRKSIYMSKHKISIQKSRKQ